MNSFHLPFSYLPPPPLLFLLKPVEAMLVLTFDYTIGVSKQNFHCKYFVFCSLFVCCLHIQISSEFFEYFKLTNLHR